jgi:hypothetical protein
LAYLPDLQVPNAPNVARLEDGLVAPGTLLRHYSPRARLLLVRGDSAVFCALARAAVERTHARGLRVGLLATDEDLPGCADLPVTVASLGAEENRPRMRRIYADFCFIRVNPPHPPLHRVRREATEYTERYQRSMLCVLAVNSVNPP